MNIKNLLATSALILVTACAVTPEPITPEEHIKSTHDDLNEMYDNYLVSDAPLTLTDSIARGLVYNLDKRMAKLEASLQNSQLSLSNYNLLPRLAANAGYTARDEFRASRSINLDTREQSLAPSYSEDRDIFEADLGLSWNILDFGLSYYQAKQQADRTLIAIEKRRKLTNNIIKEIIISYWKAQTASKLLPQINHLLAESDNAIAYYDRIQKEGLASPSETLESKRVLMQTASQLKRLRGDMRIAKAQLASLINLPPAEEFELAKPNLDYAMVPNVNVSLQKLMEYGVYNRPEVREERYQERIDEESVNKEILRLFPGVTALGSLNYNNNSLLSFNDWNQVGLKASWNLINVIQGPEAIEAAEQQVEITKTRRQALMGAILAQIAISYTQLEQAKESLVSTAQLNQVEREILKIAKDSERNETGSRLDRVQKSARAISSQLERDQAFIELQTSLTNLYTSIGFDIVPGELEISDVDSIKKFLDDYLVKLNSGKISGYLNVPEVERNYFRRGKKDSPNT